MIRIFFITLFFCSYINLFASFETERETRAVWLTTNFQLDWPPNTLDENAQKKSLEEIFKYLNSQHFNTLYFQVRSNGTIIYNSEIEPFSPYFTGEVGIRPNYDPLQYAIELGKKYNIEVHAWVNMIRCFSGSNDSVLKHPAHLRNSHPDWTVRIIDNEGKLSYWLNPGYSEVQNYLVNILIELSSKYDIDGIHLDFFRYPGKEFNDDKSFRALGNGLSLYDWRRNNITTILKKFREKVSPRNPYLKVGATPIGIRKNMDGLNGFDGYSDVFQDTEKWLRDGLVDYLAPQIYWKNPRFETIAKNWVNKSHNKNIVLGLAAYKNYSKSELDKMISTSRKIGASGVSFFRYKNIIPNSDKFFHSKAFPEQMDWKKQNKNFGKNDIFAKYGILSENEIMITWIEQNKRRVNEFRSFVLLNNTKPIKLIALDKNKVKLRFNNPTKLKYNYKIGKLNKLWNNIVESNNIEVQVPFLKQLKEDSKQNSNLILYKLNEENSLLAISSNQKQKVLINIISKENLSHHKLIELKLGLNLYRIDQTVKSIKKIIVTYSSNNKKEELNFY